MEMFAVTPIESADRAWIEQFLQDAWGSVRVVSRGKIWDASRRPGFKAVLGGSNAGLVTYRIDQGECEIVTIDSLVEGIGIGSALIQAMVSLAAGNHCRRVWLITTNDNLHALRFYQKRGFLLAALYPNALAESRKLKPEIPEIGIDSIPLRDEIELEMVLLDH